MAPVLMNLPNKTCTEKKNWNFLNFRIGHFFNRISSTCTGKHQNFRTCAGNGEESVPYPKLTDFQKMSRTVNYSADVHFQEIKSVEVLAFLLP